MNLMCQLCTTHDPRPTTHDARQLDNLSLKWLKRALIKSSVKRLKADSTTSGSRVGMSHFILAHSDHPLTSFFAILDLRYHVTILAGIYGDPTFFGSDPGFVNPVGSDPSFDNPIRSDPIRSDPVRSDPGFVNAHLISIQTLINLYLPVICSYVISTKTPKR